MSSCHRVVVKLGNESFPTFMIRLHIHLAKYPINRVALNTPQKGDSSILFETVPYNC